MLVLMKAKHEAIESAITERNLMKAFGLSYTELQEMPMWVLNCWVRQLHKERQQAKFEQDKRRCQNQQLKRG